MPDFKIKLTTKPAKNVFRMAFLPSPLLKLRMQTSSFAYRIFPTLTENNIIDYS